MSRTVRIILAFISLSLICVPARADLAAAYALVPADSAGAVLVGDIKKTSDDIAACLEGMERSHLLLGGRPIDQLRALLGITSGLNERQAAAVVYPHPEFGSTPLYVLPVFEPDDFLTANFEQGDSPGAWVHSSGTVLYAKSVGDSVIVLGENAADITAYNAGTGLADTLSAQFGDDPNPRLARADLVIYTAGPALHSMVIAARQAAMNTTEVGEGLAPGAGLSLLAALMPTDAVQVAEAALLCINFDPLGLGVNSFVALKDDSQLQAATATTEQSIRPLGLIPQRPFFIAVSMDVDGMGGTELLQTLAGDRIVLPEWLRNAGAVQFIAPPSSLGVQGGMLNEASLVIGTDDPAGLIEVIRAEFMANVDGVTPTWSAAVRVEEGVTFAGFELGITAGAWEPIEVMAGSFLFGRGGIRGFVGEVDGHVLVTFSRRPDVLARAIKAVRGENTLTQSGMLRAMGEWLPARPDVLVFVGIGPIGEMLGVVYDSITALVPLEGFEPPTIDPGTKPVGFGVDVRAGMVETGLIIPADALAVMLDVAQDQVLKSAGEAEAVDDG